jgi:uncharacterized lipoprotein YmbA
VATVLVAVLAACGTASTERYYRLDAGASSAHASPAATVSPQPHANAAGSGAAPSHPAQIRLVLAAIPQTIDRPQIIRLLGPNEMQVLEFDRWAEPVRSAVAHTLDAHLARQFPDAWIVPEASLGDASATTISVTIESMEFDAAQARLQARWLVSAPSGSQLADRLALQSASGGTAGGAVAAWSAELGEVAQAIADTVRKMPVSP